MKIEFNIFLNFFKKYYLKLLIKNIIKIVIGSSRPPYRCLQYITLKYIFYINYINGKSYL